MSEKYLVTITGDKVSQIKSLPLPFLLICLGASLVLVSLLIHTSRSASLLQFSLQYGLMVFALSIALLGFTTVVLFKRQWLTHWTGRLVNRQSTSFWELLLTVVAVALAWFFWFSPLPYSWLAQPLFQAGIVLTYLGFAALVFGTLGWAYADEQATVDSIPVRRLALLGVMLGIALAIMGLLYSRAALGRNITLVIGSIATMLVLVLFQWSRMRLPVFTKLSAEHIGRKWLVLALPILFYIVLIYSPALKHSLMGTDELRAISFVEGRSPLAAFFETSAFPEFFRPFQILQGWFLYHVFHFNYFWYQGFQIFTFALCTIALFYTLSRFVGNPLLSFLLTLLYASHLYLGDFLIYTTDVAWMVIIIANLVIVWLILSTDKPRAYLALFLLLFIAALARESGLALTGAVILYVFYAHLRLGLGRRRLTLVLLMCVAAFGLYMLARWQATGLLPNSTQVANNGYIFQTLYDENQVRAFEPIMRIGFYTYAVAGNLVNSLFPLLSNLGRFDVRIAVQFLLTVGLCLLSVIFFFSRDHISRNWSLWSPREKLFNFILRILLLAGIVVLGLNLIWLKPRLAEISLALYGSLSVFLIIAAISNRKWLDEHHKIAIFAAALILVGSGISFAYFRHRNAFLPLLGWVFLFSIVFQHLTASRWQAALRGAALVLLLAIVVVNGAQIYSTYPLPHLSAEKNDPKGLCRQRVSLKIALQVSAYYGIDEQTLLNCRETNEGQP